MLSFIIDNFNNIYVRYLTFFSFNKIKTKDFQHVNCEILFNNYYTIIIRFSICKISTEFLLILFIYDYLRMTH